MGKFTITKKSIFTIELINDAKEPLIIGYKKSILFKQLKSKDVGTVVELETTVSDKGRLYAYESNNFLLAQQEADLFDIRQANIKKEQEGF